MKAIIKINKKFSFKLKAIILSVAIIAIVALFFSLKFSEIFRKIYPTLHFSEKIKKPECDSSGGFYNSSLIVKLTNPDSNNRILYTTDGSEPSLASTLYDQPIIIENKTNNRNYLSEIPTSPRWKPPIDNIFKGTVLRTIAINEKNEKSEELVRTFFVEDVSNKKYTLPVIAITVNQKDFFGYNDGIYVLGKNFNDKDNYIRKNIPLDLPWWEYPSNYLSRGNDAERSAHIEFYNTDGKLGFESNIGVRINGNATRGYAQKSLRILFKKKYGQTELNYPLFSESTTHIFRSIILRNSGNDWDKTMFRDGLMQKLMKNTHVDIQEDRPSIVFINGEYWGIHNIRERFDENYLSNKYHVSSDSITILELQGSLSYGKKSKADEFKKLLTFVKEHDLSVSTNYEFVKSKMDIESFSDFLIANIFYCNSDWPNNNVKFWCFNAENFSSISSIQDGRWHWMLYDTDWGFGYNNLSTPSNNLLEKAKKTGSVGVLFKALIANTDFVMLFTQRFQTLLNSIFKTPHVISEINKMEQSFSPEMQEHIDRWRVIGSLESWQKNVEVLRDFASKRPKIQVEQINKFFDLKGDKKISINY